MLNLDRQCGASLVIVKGDDLITVKVRSFKGDVIELAVEAPNHLKINHRVEKLPDFRPSKNSSKPKRKVENRDLRNVEQHFEPAPKPRASIIYKKRRLFTPPT